MNSSSRDRKHTAVSMRQCGKAVGAAWHLEGQARDVTSEQRLIAERWRSRGKLGQRTAPEPECGNVRTEKHGFHAGAKRPSISAFAAPNLDESALIENRQASIKRLRVFGRASQVSWVSTLSYRQYRLPIVLHQCQHAVFNTPGSGVFIKIAPARFEIGEPSSSTRNGRLHNRYKADKAFAGRT